jgi:hypothetical protein
MLAKREPLSTWSLQVVAAAAADQATLQVVAAALEVCVLVQLRLPHRLTRSPLAQEAREAARQ